jgi:hypothetical protein
MAEFKSKSLDWLDKLKTLRAQSPDATTDELKEVLNHGKSQISDLQAIDECFDLAAVEKVRQAAQSNPPYTLSFRSARALACLAKAEVADLPKTFHDALDATLSRRLATGQIESLVKSLVEGNGDNPTIKDKNQLTANIPDDLKKVLELFKKVEAEIACGDGQTACQVELRALLKKGSSETEEDEDSGKKGKAGKKSKSSSDSGPSWIWEWMLGVKFMKQLRSKAKKGELTLTDKILIVLDKILVGPLGWVLKHLAKLIKETAKEFWHWLKKTLGDTFSNIIKWGILILIICAFLWGAGKVFQLVVVKPLHWIESKVVWGFHGGGSKPEAPVIPAPILPSPESAAPAAPYANGNNNGPLAQPNLAPQLEASAQVPVGSSQLGSAKLKTSNSKLPTHHSPPAAAYQPAISFVPSVEDPKLLKLEIAALQNNVYVKDFPLTPDESMPGDVALSRMQDLADPDKYTMMIGGGKQIIKLVTTTTTGLALLYKSADLFGVLNGDGQMNFLWEDVKAIHTNEIVHSSPNSGTQQPNINYQCSLVVKGAKYPLTLQCGSTDDLENLVSTLEYFIRHSRLGRDTPLTGIPYPDQGVKLTNDCVVALLWANSPMDKAGVGLGDHFWSVGKNTSEQQGRKELEAGLQSLPAALFTVSPAEWDKAHIEARQPGSDNAIHPQLRKVSIGQ